MDGQKSIGNLAKADKFLNGLESAPADVAQAFASMAQAHALIALCDRIDKLSWAVNSLFSFCEARTARDQNIARDSIALNEEVGR